MTRLTLRRTPHANGNQPWAFRKYMAEGIIGVHSIKVWKEIAKKRGCELLTVHDIDGTTLQRVND